MNKIETEREKTQNFPEIIFEKSNDPREGRTKFSFLIVSLLLLLRVEVSEAGLCSYSNVDRSHTMCAFKPRSCSGKKLLRTGDLTCMDKEIILKSHNQLRRNLALGRVKGQPAALNMETMIWSDELAEIAQRWADQCVPGHDTSRNTAQHTVGQNVAAVWTYEHDEGDEPDFPTQIEAWFDEVKKGGFGKSGIDPFRYSKIAGHYTQLAWADTYMVGCGYSYYHDKSLGYTKLYVCNYAPGGNIVGGSMYKVGYPGQPYCIQQGLKPNVKMQGLCVRDDVSYENECAKHNEYFRDPHQESHSSPHLLHFNEHTMIPPPPPPQLPSSSPLLSAFTNKLTPPPPLPQTFQESPHKKQRTKSHHHQFHSTTVSQLHSHFNIHSRNEFHHPPPSHIRKGLPNPFGSFKDLFSPWKFFNKFSG